MGHLVILVVVVLPVAWAGTEEAKLPDQGEPMALSWSLVTGKAAFSPRDTAEDLVFGGKMWLSNAYYHGNVLTRDLWCSADGVSWTEVSSATPYDGYRE